AHLAGQQDVFAGLRHRAVGRADDQNSAVHLGCAGDHVLDVVGVAGTVDVGVVPLGRLVLHVGGRDSDRLGGIAIDAAFGDVLVVLGRRPVLLLRAGAEGGGQGGLAMVDVTDGADVHVWFFAFEYSLCHGRTLRNRFVDAISLLRSPKVHRSRMQSWHKGLNLAPRPYQGGALP